MSETRERLLRDQNESLSLLADEVPVVKVFTQIVERVETLHSNAKCGIFMIDRTEILSFAPNWPAELLTPIKNQQQFTDLLQEIDEEAFLRNIEGESTFSWLGSLSTREVSSVWMKPIKSATGVPLGLFCVLYCGPVEFHEIKQELIKAYANMVSIAMKREQTKRETHYLACNNELKGLHNHDFLNLDEDIRRAIENGEFELHYQPKVQTQTFAITGAEALIRWVHPTRGLISPAEFIPVAEKTGSIVSIGHFVIDTVLRQLKEWETTGHSIIPVAVNVSPQELVGHSFVDYIREGLCRHGVAPRWLELEITETAILNNIDAARQTISELSEMGITIALDDFGTGFSSLSFLTEFDIQTIKIDRSFVAGMSLRGQRTPHCSIVEAMVSLAHSLGITVVAEGVEIEEQLDFLQLVECDEVQGYFFSCPVSAEEFEELVPRGYPV